MTPPETGLLQLLSRRLPHPLRSPLRRIYIGLRSLRAASPRKSDVVANYIGDSAGSEMSKNPLGFVKPGTLVEINSHLANPKVLFQIQYARQVVARDRAEHFFEAGAVSRLQDHSAMVAFNTLDYNLEGARTAPMLDRPMLMTNVVSSLGRVQQNIGGLDVLSIGPRSEIEIFGLIGAGFSADRIKAVDLFSYSPLVDTGDMHHLPYADSSFDVLFVGWVLSYSRDQAAVARELTRVGRDGAVIALAGDYSDDSRNRPTFRNDTTHMQSCNQILALFGDHVGRVWFRHDPELPNVAMVMTVFEIKKPKGS